MKMSSKVGGIITATKKSKSLRFCSQKRIIVCLVCIAFFPPIFFHFRLRRFHMIQVRKCGWVNNPPLVCAHGGDSSKAFPNTISAYQFALGSKVDCVEIDVSRSSDGVCLLSMTGRDLQRISGNDTSRVGQLTSNEIEELGTVHLPSQKFDGAKIPTLEDALKLVSSSVRQVILDAKVGPPLFERGLAQDILSDVEKTQCRNCLVWAKSDSLARDVIKHSPDTMKCRGIVTGWLHCHARSIYRSYNQFTEDERCCGGWRVPPTGRSESCPNSASEKQKGLCVDSMHNMLFEGVDAVVMSDPTLLQREMQDIGTQCLEEGFSFSK